MSEMLFKPATRGAMKLLIGLFGKSGGGKTLSALYVARGIVGPKGKIGLVDTENRRGTAFLDLVPGSYEVLDFQPPFSPLRYCEAMDAAEKQGVECLVIDSTSHEWLGEGGYLDLKEEALKRMAGDDWKKREKCAMAAAAQVKPKTHSKFVQKVLRCPMSVIMCFRAHEKVRMEKQDGETKIKVDETPSPMQDGDLIYEMLIAGEVYSRNGVGGFFRVTGPHCKHTHPSILPLLPTDDQQLSISHGEALAKWCSSGTAPKSIDVPVDGRKVLIAAIWSAGKSVRGTEKSWDGFEIWALGNKLISDTETIKTLPESRLLEVLNGTKALLESQPA